MKIVAVILGVALIAVTVTAFAIVRQRGEEYDRLMAVHQKTVQLLTITQGDLIAVCSSVEQEQKGRPYTGLIDLVKIIRGRLAENTVTTKDGVTIPKIPQ